MVNYFIALFFIFSSTVSVAQQRLWSPPQYGTQSALGYDINSFSVPSPLKSEVDFWIKIYTQYTTRQGVFHRTGNIDEILGEIDLTDVYLNPQWGPIRKEKEAERIIERQRKLIAKKHNIKNHKTVRLQMGLSDRMRTAIFESGRYLPMMEKIFKEKNIPVELTRLVFVESSFNVEAKSKVGASGLWQIMPAVGKKYKYIKKDYDKRDHPEYATKVAADILKQNYQILKSWPLAVTSYNFGVGRMLKVQKKMKEDDAVEIFSSPHLKKHIGFASRNFYATFLAALHVESHANIYFGEPMMVAEPQKVKNIYLEKPTLVSDLVKKYNLTHQEFKKMNTHVTNKHLKLGGKIPKGTLITLPSEKTKVAEKDSGNS